MSVGSPEPTVSAHRGDTVVVHYAVSLTDGTSVTTSERQEPLRFTIGADEVLPGVEAAVIGMRVGEHRQTTVTPPEAYGPRREELVTEVPRETIPPGAEVRRGARVVVQGPDARPLPVTVVDIAGDSVTLDANHPLAGRTLRLDLELVRIERDGAAADGQS